ncbi:MAG TPA: SpoIIE family protein phosphatase [Mycobacteriales bacterium]|nr:SpoIIE family protein phosphatase [Mycobacteriales bacterium]
MSVVDDAALQEFLDALVEDDPQQLYDSAPCGYLSTDPSGLVLKANQTFLTMTGYTHEQLVGRLAFVDLLTAGGRIYHETHYAPLLHMQGSAREIALDLVTADGGRLPVLVNSVLERDTRGEAQVIRTAVFDATQRREYERELLLSKTRAEESEARARALAQTLQQTLIPPTPPNIPGLDVAASYRPAGDGSEVGGDFYDVFQVGLDDWVVTVGDVAGKGVDAAVVTALVRYTLRAAAVENADPSSALRVLNTVLLRHDTERFCTVAFVRIRLDAAVVTCTLAVAGHPLPLLRTAHGEVTEAGVPGSAVGVVDELSLTDVEVRLSPGDCLVLFTDGVHEGRRGKEFFGLERLAELVAGPPAPAELATTVVREVVAFQEGVTRDDIAVVVVGVPA